MTQKRNETGGSSADTPKPNHKASPRTAQKATLHDVAALVGVSPRTVSRVVNDEGGFSKATASRVLAAISELDYRPNLLARGLITNKTDTLAFIVPVIDDPFFPEVAQGVQHAALAQGLSMFLAVTENDPAIERMLLDRMISQAIDGAILFPTFGSGERLQSLAAQGLPMVVIDNIVQHPNIACVRSDLEAGVEMAVAHLRETGRRSVAMITRDSAPGQQRRREQTFRGLAGGKEATVVGGEATYDGGYQAMTQLLQSYPDTDGVFAYNDLTAIGAMAACADAGVSVPEQVAVIGCDDIEMSARVSPRLTTVRIDRERLGSEAVSRLLALRDTDHAPEVVTLPVELIIRQSS